MNRDYLELNIIMKGLSQIEKSNKLLDLAFSHFAKKGINFSLTEIANDMGMHEQSLYSYYGSKEALITSAIDREISRFLCWFYDKSGQISVLDNGTQLKRIFMETVAYFTEDIDKLLFWRQLLFVQSEMILKSNCNKLKDFDRFFYLYIKKIFDVGFPGTISDHDTKKAFILEYFTLLQGSLQAALLYPNTETYKKYLEQIWKAYWNGLYLTLSS